jgi:hypothetical protein
VPDRGRRMAQLLGLIAAAALVLAGLAAAAISDGADRTSYVTDGHVYAIAHQPGGNTYLGGDFDHVGPRSGHGLSLGAVGTTNEALAVPALSAPDFPEVAGGDVRAVVADGHGGWFIGGDFTSVAGQDVPRLAHILSTGELDESWTPKPNNTVLALALDSTDYQTSLGDWTLYVGGKFTQIQSPNVNSQNRNFLAAWRINAGTGAPDTQGPDPNEPGQDLDNDEPLKWSPGQQAGSGGNTVHALAVRTVTVNVGAAPGTPTPTPAVFVGGEFTAIGKGTAANRNRLAAVWGDGALKPTDGSNVEGVVIDSWNPGPTSGTVKTLALGPSRDNAAGHTFTPVYFGGAFTNNLAAHKFDLDKNAGTATHGAYTGWTPAPNPGGAVSALALDAGSNLLYVGGDFTTISAGNQAREHLAGLSAIPDDAVITTNCVPIPCPATLQDWKPDADGSVRAIAVSDDSATLYTGGDFTEIGDAAIADGRAAQNGLAAVAAVGEDDAGKALPWDASPAGGSTNALATDADSVFAGGGFFSVGASERDNLAALDPSGALVDAFETGTSCEGAGCPDEVRALALAPDAGQLYVGGGFTKIDGQSREHLAALNLGPGGEVIDGWAPDPDGWVLTLDVAGQRLYAGGAFDHIGAVPNPGDPPPARSRIAALDRGTGAVLDWSPNARRTGPGGEVPLNVYDIEASCGTVYAGGSFNRIGAVPDIETQPVRNKIAELDPNSGAATAWDPSPPPGSAEAVYALAVHGGIVYAGGHFAVIGSDAGRATRQNIAALRVSDGSATSWNPDAGYVVRALGVGDDGQTVYAGGLFDDIGGAERWGLAALSADGLGSATSWDPSAREPGTVQPQQRSNVFALAVAGDNVYAGGEFTDLGTSAQRGYGQFTSGAESASSEPSCGGGQQASQAVDATAPSVGQAFAADGGRTLVVSLSEPAELRVDVTGKAAGLMPLGRDASCSPDTAQIRAKLRRAFGSKLRKVAKRKRAKKILQLIAKRACPLKVPPRSLAANGAAGENRISLTGTGPLPPGSYQAVINARDGSGNQSPPVTVNFEVSP